MKTGLHTFLIGIIILTLASGLFAEVEKPNLGVVTANRLNVRGRPLGTAEICCQLENNDKVEILERKNIPTIGNTTEEWVRIVLPEQATVWLQSNFIGEGGVIQSKINGRAGPSLMWPVLCTLVKGDVVNVRTNHLDWSGIAPPRSASAWVAGLYVSNVVEEVPVAIPAKEETTEE